MFKHIGLLLVVIFSGLLCNSQESRDFNLIAPIELKPFELYSQVTDSLSRESDLHNDQLRQFDFWMEEAPILSTQKRGPFAFEPLLRGQGGDRINLVVDGIRISGACTDHMDPVTSYIEPANFRSMSINGGGGALSGSSTAGSIEIKTNSPAFNQNTVSTELGSEYRSNGNALFSFGKMVASMPKTAASASFTHRVQDEYMDGQNQKVNYSQFSKYNFHLDLKRRLGKHNVVSMKYIGDRGRNIGYPGLLMDVSIADANIFGLNWALLGLNDRIKSIKFGAYLSDVYHEMDDTKRPAEEVAMHMDMPGWATTAGVTLDGKLAFKKELNLDFQGEYYTRNSRAEMTMYPENEGEMFLLTWPNIHREVYRLALNAEKKFNKSKLLLSGNLEHHNLSMNSLLGYRQFSIFGVPLDSSSSYMPYSLDLAYTFSLSKESNLLIKAGRAQRAPSRTEIYGFYLFNAEDGYDYLGNPELTAESSTRLDIAYGVQRAKLRLKLSGFLNYYEQYIFGVFQTDIGGATPGTLGLKRFENIPQVYFTGFEFEFVYSLNRAINIRSSASYVYAVRDNNTPMPQIAPFEFSLSPFYSLKSFTFNARLYSNATQLRIDSSFGEDKTSSWAIVDLSVYWKKRFSNNNSLKVKTEISNLFDQYYWGHLDWRNIPRQGRSFNFSLIYAFSKKLKAKEF